MAIELQEAVDTILAAIDGELSKALATVKSHADRMSEVQGHADAFRKQTEIHETAVSKHQSEIHELKSQLKSAQEARAQLQTKHDTAVVQVRQLSEKAKHLEAALKGLQKK
jgi:chromosome segregation ATPase